MKFGVPWSVKGIRPEARETAKEAARRSGMSLGEWLNSVILHQAAEDGVQTPPLAYDDDDSDGHELSAVHQRLDDLTRCIERFTRTGPSAYAPKRSRNDDDQIADLIGRLDRRLDQFANTSRAIAPSTMRAPAGPPALDLAIAENAARQRSQSGGTVSPMLEALVQSLTDKIDLIQQSCSDNVAASHLEDQIVALVQRLDASDSRLGHLEAIERGLADLLVHIEDMRANKNTGGLRAESSAGVGDLKLDIARTQDTLEAVHGTLGHVVDRLVMIENDIRGEGRTHPATKVELAAPQPPVGKVAARMVSDNPPQVAAPAPVTSAAAVPPAPPQSQPIAPAPKRLSPAGRLPINPDLPPNQPLEPGSGPPPLRANPAARIAASQGALGGSGPTAAAPGGKSGFIAAARRAAQAAVQAPRNRTPRTELFEADEAEPVSLRDKLKKRAKSLFIAASIVGVVVGSIQIVGNFYEFGKPERANVKTASDPDTDIIDTTAPNAKPEAAASLVANPLEPPKLLGISQFAPLPGNNMITATPPLNLSPSVQSLPSLLNPPSLNTQPLGPKSDITGSISRPGAVRQPAPSNTQDRDRLPIAIGGASLRNAATAGDGAAAYEVAQRFAKGRGVPVNLEDAAHWYERAANKGLAPAQFHYASLLEKGQGVKKDLVQARRLYLAAASKGNGKAMHNLAVLYAEGIEGKPDYVTAAQWFRKAALRGIADSQYNLGVLCARGLGTEKNAPESYKWFALAAAQGDRESAKKRDEVASPLEAGALAAAQHMVKSFVAEHQPDEATVIPEPAGGWDNAAGAAPPRVKPRAAGPLSLGAYTQGKQ